MKKTAVLIPPLFLLFIILAGCKTNSFNKQRYTDFAHTSEKRNDNKKIPPARPVKENENNPVSNVVHIPSVVAMAEVKLNSGGERESIFPLNTPRVVYAGKDIAGKTNTVQRTNPVQKSFKELKTKVSGVQSHRGPVGWLVDTVLGIVLMIVIFVAIVVVLVVVLL